MRFRSYTNDVFRRVLSLPADIETRYRTNVLAVPLASVTMRSPKTAGAKIKHDQPEPKPADSNSLATADPPAGTNANTAAGTNIDAKTRDAFKPIEVVFVVDGDHAKMVPVKRGIGDDNFWEITDGLKEGQEIITGGYRAVGRDLEDGKRIRKGGGPDESSKKQP